MILIKNQGCVACFEQNAGHFAQDCPKKNRNGRRYSAANPETRSNIQSQVKGERVPIKPFSQCTGRLIVGKKNKSGKVEYMLLKTPDTATSGEKTREADGWSDVKAR
jgi:hypothetical protein